MWWKVIKILICIFCLWIPGVYSLSHVWLFATVWAVAHQAPLPWDCSGKNTGVGSLSLFQGIFPTQGSNQGLPHCRRILYDLSHQGSPRILQWVAYPFSRGSSWSKNQTRVSCIAHRFFTNWATRKAPIWQWLGPSHWVDIRPTQSKDTKGSVWFPQVLWDVKSSEYPKWLQRARCMRGSGWQPPTVSFMAEIISLSEHSVLNHRVLLPATHSTTTLPPGSILAKVF